MPAALNVDREAVKTLAVAVGVREAARQTGLNEARVLQWSKRDQWFKPTPQPPRQSDVITVIKPSVALASTLAEQGEATRLHLSKAALKAGSHLGKLPGAVLVKPDIAQSAKHWTGVAGTVHGWQEKQQQTNVMVNVALLGS